jgi:hypothetical protein
MKRDASQLTQAWETYHREFGFNIIPVGHEKIVALAIEAQLDPTLRVRLADYFEVAPAKVLDNLRGFLKYPTFSSEIRKLLAEFLPHYAERAVNSIPSLSSITGVRKYDDRNSYVHFYETRIDDAIAEKMVKIYGDMATGVAVLLREDDQLVVVDFDNRQALIDLLAQLGYPCDEATLEATLLRVFPSNPIVKTFRGYHIYTYDADLTEAVKTTRKLNNIDIKVSRGYVLLPPSLAGFEPSGVTVNLVYYQQVRPLLPEDIRAPLPTQVRDYLLAQIRPQVVSTTLSFTPTPQPTSPDLKSFVTDSLIPYWRKGVRDQLVYPLAGVLRRAGITLDEALDIVTTICDRAGDEEKRDRLYQVRRQYSLPFQPRGKRPYCAGISKFQEACLTAGMPLQVFNNLIARIFGLKVTTNLQDWLEDYKQIAEKVAAVVRNDLVFNEKTLSWWVYNEDEKRWIETKREDILHFVTKATLEVCADIEEIVRMSHNDNIPKQVAQKLNKLINSQFIRNSVLPTLEILLSVNLNFPHIPADYIPAEFQQLKLHRITFHRNGCLLWFEGGETYFIPNTDTFITQREFYATQTLPSVVDENADMSPFIDYLAKVMGGKANAEYFLKLASTVLATQRNIYRKAIIFFGGGQNGKNSTIDIIKAALGDLVQQTPSAAIIKAGETLNLASLYKLKNSAIAYIDETPDKNWNIDIFKAVTGSWSIVAKRYYKDPEDMPITFILIILTNHLPKEFERQSQALEDRFIVIKFPYRFADVQYETQYVKKRDPAIVEALMANTAATIQAFRHYYKLAAQEGFLHDMPPAVLESTNDIRLKANSIGFFIQSCVIDDPANFVYVSDMYKLYQEWCKRHEVKSVKIEEFREYLKCTNYKLERTGRGYICHCVSLKTDFLNNGNEPEPTPSLLYGDEPEPTPTPSLIASDNGSNNEVSAAVADNDDGQDYLDEFPF